MHDPNESAAPDRRPATGAVARARGRWALIGVPAVLGALVVASQTWPAPAAPVMAQPSSGRHLRLPAAVPPAGQTWIEGVVTDQADHAQDNVNVEAWPADPAATAPVASALTYGGSPSNPGYTNGFFMLQVPSDQPYRIVFSAVSGKEDGDQFRMKRYGGGRPIMVRNLAAATGRVRNLGAVALARQGRVASATRAVLSRARITSPQRAKVRVTLTSPFVTNVTGRVVVRVAGRRAAERVTLREHGKAVVTLPRVKRPGTYQVRVSFTGSGTVLGSRAKPVKLVIHKRR
ncbi:hypothetical protein [Nocardioides sp.]|uniref:hypothetical protein n=1 Tax=Nocardioides sp. TaxID=35761 RepID=UPI003D0AB189